MRLWELAEQYDLLYERALAESSDDGEVPADLVAALDSLEDDIGEKLNGCVRVLKNLMAEQESYQRESNRLQRRATALKRRCEWLKRYIVENMRAMGIEKTGGIPQASVIPNSQPSVKILDESKVPHEFDATPSRVISKSAILEAIMSGREVEGVVVEHNYHLRIV